MYAVSENFLKSRCWKIRIKRLVSHRYDDSLLASLPAVEIRVLESEVPRGSVRLEVVSTATALGKATDECPVEGDAQGLEIGFNNRYVLDALRAAPTDRLLLWLSGPTAPCVIKPESDDGSFLYLILPVRVFQ